MKKPYNHKPNFLLRICAKTHLQHCRNFPDPAYRGGQERGKGHTGLDPPRENPVYAPDVTSSLRVCVCVCEPNDLVELVLVSCDRVPDVFHLSY